MQWRGIVRTHDDLPCLEMTGRPEARGLIVELDDTRRQNQRAGYGHKNFRRAIHKAG